MADQGMHMPSFEYDRVLINGLRQAHITPFDIDTIQLYSTPNLVPLLFTTISVLMAKLDFPYRKGHIGLSILESLLEIENLLVRS